MAKLALNKSALNHERKQLAIYRRFLPSLELKRRQLIALREKARTEAAQVQAQMKDHEKGLGERLPMVASPDFDLTGMVQVERLKLEDENVVGVMLPRLVQLECRIREYSFLSEPHWVDAALRELQRSIELRAQVHVARERLERLEKAVQKITQRVNLFTEVLIPQAQERIRKISIYLGDLERAAVIRAKIAKQHRELS